MTWSKPGFKPRTEPQGVLSAWPGAFFALLLLAVGVCLFWKWGRFDALLALKDPTPEIKRATLWGLALLLSPAILLYALRLRRGAFFWLVFVDLALSLLILTDLLCRRYYADLFSVRNLVLSLQVGEISDSVWGLLDRSDLYFFRDIPILLLCGIPLFRGFRRYVLRACPVKRIAACVCVLLLATASLWGLKTHLDRYNAKIPGALRTMWDRVGVAVGVGGLPYHFADLVEVTREQFDRPKISQAKKEELAAWLRNRAGGGEDAPFWGASRGENLIVIQVESLQSFVLGAKVGAREVTPHLNRRLREGKLAARDLYVQTAFGNSCDAELMANTSLYPAASGVAFTRFAANSYSSLASSLRDAGYRTIALHGDRPGFWNRFHMYPSLGFERYVSKNEFQPGPAIGLGLADRDFFAQTQEILKSERAPFYAFLVTLSSHYPYSFKPFEDVDFPLGALSGTLLGNSLRSIHYLDACLEEFLSELEKSSLASRSVVAIYGDHSAIPPFARGELGKYLAHDATVFDDEAAWLKTRTVPFLLQASKPIRDAFAQVRPDEPAGQMDIAPTLAHLMGVTLETPFGVDLFRQAGEKSGKSEPLLFRNGTFIDGRLWVIPDREKAYDLESGAEAPFAPYASKFEDILRPLEYSDLLLEANLLDDVRKINRDQPRAE